MLMGPCLMLMLLLGITQRDCYINFINTWEKVSKLWRDKQIAYTWYYTSIGYKNQFFETEDLWIMLFWNFII